ncbi:actin polymerization protein Bzz1 [Mucor ambiguus]|uniref:m7GpppX diphosphatase n=1 Tax=Mucor ambiguus TaxID=91626 RepID=A0A0C9MY99_9FUNG|nr:actin polymerization protein Bzz1 [Mucor ambiguus]
MTFGTDLKDQVPSILKYVGDGINSLTQFRNFIKERSNIEREYAQKLDTLTRKYKAHNSNKKTGNTADQQDDWDWDDTSSTTASAWSHLLDQTALVAKSRLRLVDDLNNVVVDSLRGTAVRKEESRKKHAAFYHKLKSERDRTYAEKDKAKQLYDDACAEIENIKAKISKSSGDVDKLQRQMDACLLDRDNKKNLYLLSISVANAEREKYFEDDIPILADHLEDLDASRITALKSILKNYIDMETQLITTVQKCHDDTLVSIEKLSPSIDAGVFTRSALGAVEATEKAANVTFTFIPWNGGANAAETIIDRDDNLVASDSAVIFLNNKLIKDRRQLDVLADDLSKRSADMSQLESAVKAIENRASAEYDKSNEKLMDLIRDITLLSTQKVRVKSEVDLIIQNIGDDGLRAENHDFKSSSFTIPTTCDLCNSTIWGLSNKGLTCRACGFNCHAKCEMKVAPNCSKKKGQINPQPLPSTLQPVSTRAVRKESVSGGSISSIPASYSTSTYDQPTSAIAPSFAASSSPDYMRSLYAYDAQNVDELSIAEGDVLTIVEPDDGTGWIKAQLGDQVGLVPANYIEYINPQNDAAPVANIMDTAASVSDSYYTSPTTPPAVDQFVDSTGTQHDDIPPPPPPPPMPGSAQPSPPTETVVALYNFEAVNAEELNIRQGDIITHENNPFVHSIASSCSEINTLLSRQPMSTVKDIVSKFQFTRVLANDTRAKLVYVLGQIDGKDCIISFEKTQYDDTNISSLTHTVNSNTMDDIVENNIYGWCMARLESRDPDTRIKTIYPATDVHIAKYEAQSRVMLVETPEQYESITLPYIKSIPGKRTTWVHNILNGSAEADRVIFHDHDPENGFVILPDMKWDGRNETLYWVAISMRSDILSLRSLSSQHVGLLKRLREASYRLVKEKANLSPSQLRLFIHYQPSYYHFHVHITAVAFSDAPGVVSGQAHLLDTVINNIELYPDYYQKATIPFVIGEKHPLTSGFSEK